MDDTYTMTTEERKALIESIIDDIFYLREKQDITPACAAVSISDTT